MLTVDPEIDRVDLIHGKFCLTWSTNSTLGHSVDSAQLGSAVIDFVDLSYLFKSHYMGDQ